MSSFRNTNVRSSLLCVWFVRVNNKRSCLLPDIKRLVLEVHVHRAGGCGSKLHDREGVPVHITHQCSGVYLCKTFCKLLYLFCVSTCCDVSSCKVQHCRLAFMWWRKNNENRPCLVVHVVYTNLSVDDEFCDFPRVNQTVYFSVLTTYTHVKQTYGKNK